MGQKLSRLKKLPLFLILLMISAPSAFSAPPTGKITSIPTQFEIKSDFAIFFTDMALLTAFKPSFSSIIEYPESSQYTAVLPTCQEDPLSPCLANLEVSTNQGASWSKNDGYTSYAAKNFGKNASLQPGQYSAVTKNWMANPSTLLPAGSNNKVFTIPNAKHAGGNQYLVQTVVNGTSALQGNNARASSLDITIFPIKVYSAPAPNTCSIWLDYCFEIFEFPTNVKFRVTLDLKYLSEIFSGWFQTRMFDSSVSQPSATSYGFEGFPVVVSNAQANFYRPFEEVLMTQFEDARTGITKFGQPFKLVLADSNSSSSMANWIKYEKAIGSKAVYDSTIWHVVSYSTTIQKNIYQGMSGCLTNKNGVLGYVSTNSTVYEVSAPSWDDSSKSLSFKVASPTFDAQGDKNSGVYELAIQKDVAKCLWGDALINPKATIEVLDDAGSKQIATTVFAQKGNWIYFRAYGFHYSTPSIKVNLSKNTEVAATPVASPFPADASKSKLLTITCLKGKVTKKVTAVKPKCPTGFKKK
jgi:hypothetical protein